MSDDGEWIEVSAGFPPRMKRVLVMTSEGWEAFGTRFIGRNGKERWALHGCAQRRTVTHWRELPPRPKQKGKP